MQKFLVLIILGAVVVGGGAVYLLINDREVDEVQNTENSEVEIIEPSTSAPVNGHGTLTNLLALAQNLECTINYQTKVSVSGTYFTSQGKMRGDFVVPSDEGEVLSSLIMRDNTMYTWSEIDGQKYGMQFDLNEVKAAKEKGESPETREPVPLDAAVDYDCKPWVSVDGSIFEPPSDIIFQDFSKILNQGMEFGTIYEEKPDTASQCELCAQVPAGAGQNECKKAFSCE